MPKELKAKGRPTPTLKASPGQKYRDLATGRVYWMGPNGWEQASELVLAPTRGQKRAYVRAARISGMTLEEWVLMRLDMSEALQRGGLLITEALYLSPSKLVPTKI